MGTYTVGINGQACMKQGSMHEDGEGPIGRSGMPMKKSISLHERKVRFNNKLAWTKRFNNNNNKNKLYMNGKFV